MDIGSDSDPQRGRDIVGAAMLTAEDKGFVRESLYCTE